MIEGIVLYDSLDFPAVNDLAVRLSPSSNRLLASLPPEELRSVMGAMEEVALSSRRPLKDAQGSFASLYFIGKGLVSLCTPSGKGEDVETSLIGKEGVVGAPLALGVMSCPGRAVVRVDGKAWRLAANHLPGLMELNKTFAALLLRYAATQMFETAQNAACASRHTIAQRLARWLLTSADRLAAPLVTCTHDTLSQALGVRRAGVTVGLGQIEQTGAIRQNRGSVDVLDRHKLETRSCDCYSLSRLTYQRVMG